MTPAGAGRSYRSQWSLYVDWCTALDIAPLSLTAPQLAEFLADNPAGDAVQLRRVSAINRGHLDAGLPPPGRATSLRLAVDSVRAARIVRRGRRYQAIAMALPTAGSTAALFGRRDAVLLMLAGAGLPLNAVSALDRTDVGIDGGSVWIGAGHRLRIDPDVNTGFDPAAMWERWCAVLQFSDRYPSTTLLSEHLQESMFPDMSGWPERPGPVAVPIDRWGHMPLPVAAMTAAEVGSVIAAHSAGHAPHHTERRPHTLGPSGRGNPDQALRGVTDELGSVEFGSAELDPGYYASGVDARRRAHTALSDVPGMVDDVEDRIEALLQRTLDLLGDDTAPH